VNAASPFQVIIGESPRHAVVPFIQAPVLPPVELNITRMAINPSAPRAMFTQEMILAALTMPSPETHPLEDAISRFAELAKTRATMANSSGQITKDVIERANAAMA
jgi:hypothetical protein